MKPIQRIFIMMWIMSVQTLVLACILIAPHIWYVFFVLWWLLAGVFWWQFAEGMKHGR